MKRGFIAEHATVPLVEDVQQAEGSIIVGETEASSCNDDLPYMLEMHGVFTLSDSEPHFCRKGKVAARPSPSPSSSSLPEAQQVQIFVKEGPSSIGTV